MKKNYKNLIIGAAAIFFLFFVFNLSFAANTFVYPWSNPDNGIPGLINRLYLVGLGLAGGSAFVVLIWGAILYTISGAVDKKTEAKEWIKGAIYGLILLLGAYLILYTINPDLVNMRFVLPALNVPADTTGGSSALAGYNRNDIQSGVRSTGSIAELASQATLTEATVRSNIKLNGSGLQILGGDTPCGQGIYSGTTKGCVSFDGARGATVNEMLYVADLIGGKNMIITSVTEGNHAAGEASHANGNKFDTQGTDGVNGKLDKFITQDQSRFESVGTRTDIDGKTLVPLFKNKETGAVWALEPNLTYTNSSGQTQTRPRHWDVQIK